MQKKYKRIIRLILCFTIIALSFAKNLKRILFNPTTYQISNMEVKENQTLSTTYSWQNIFEDKELVQTLLTKNFPAYLQKCRWFGGKSKKIKQFRIQYLLVFPFLDTHAYLLIIEANYIAAYSESYFLPLFFTEDEENKKIDRKAIITTLDIAGKQGVLMDAIYDEDFRQAIFQDIVAQKQVNLNEGALCFNRGSILDAYPTENPIKSVVLKVDQSNTSVIYEDKFFFKIYRNLFREINPDVEITRFLTENAGFQHSPVYAGSLTWKRPDSPDVSLGLMQQKVENEGDAWTYLNGKVKTFFEKVRELRHDLKELEKVPLYKPLSIRDLEPEMVDLIGYETLKSIEKLAQRTAEMHIAISSDRSNYTFMPASFNEDYAVWLKNRLSYQLDRRIDLVEKNLDELEGLALEYAKTFLEKKEEIINIFINFNESKMMGKRIRIHGDYHLGQVLRKGDDFVILDFEGEPESTIRDRKVKQPPIKDVAGMIRSFHYAVYANIFEQMDLNMLPFDELIEAGSRYYRSIVAVYLNSYLKTAMANSLAIGYEAEIDYLLKYHLLEKAIYELGYEMNSRPTWALIPLKGIINLLESTNLA
jgi:trehalose synthase-fused probable maltokinase